MPEAPSTLNYYLGKGILKFDRFDADGLPTGLFDLGNAPAFSILPVVEKLAHYSSRGGVREKDLEVVTLVGATVKFTLDEMSAKNLAMAMLGEVSGATVRGLTTPQLQGEIQFFGTNDVGPNYNAAVWKVSLKPTSELGFISDDWAKVEFEGEALSDAANHPASPYFDITDVTGS
jgi:hypothetical protein